MSGDFPPPNVCVVCSNSPPVLSTVKMVLLQYVRQIVNDDEFFI